MKFIIVKHKLCAFNLQEKHGDMKGLELHSLTGNPKLLKDLMEPSWLAVTITRLHVAEIVVRQW